MKALDVPDELHRFQHQRRRLLGREGSSEPKTYFPVSFECVC